MTIGSLWLPSLGPSAPAPLFVQQAAEGQGSPVSIQHNTTANNYLMLCVVANTGGNTLTMSVSDSKSNTWVVDTQFQNTGNLCVAGIARGTLTSALTTSDTITISLTGSGAGKAVLGVQALEFTAAKFTASPLDKTEALSAGNAASINIATGTLTQAKELILTCIGTPVVQSWTWTVPSGFTEIPMGVTNNITDSAYETVNSTSSVTGTWHISISEAIGCAVATYKLA